jgi:hypothetical protein
MNAINSFFGSETPAILKFSVIFLIIALGLFLLWVVFSRR